MTRNNSTHFTTQISFPRRDNPALASEKPYVLDYFPGRGIRKTNIEFEVVRNIEVQDLRESSLSFEKNGVGVTQLMTAMEYPDFQDVEKVESCYLQEARDAISGFLGADDVYVIDYNIRRRDATFPSATGSSYDAAQPVVVAHGDYTPRDAYERIKILFEEEAEAKAKQRFQIVKSVCLYPCLSTGG
ncbi:hypothetical protein PMG11_05349 [Penicillium brasilianum]|uniref:Uncharacterized protein n=1 Tax=Penicillium brasilianum TaxID=104259 RepID=A0A0F7VI16_PENBI|nr:hypothetical protein PMG11_05349 [Penicillium brasilianum]